VRVRGAAAIGDGRLAARLRREVEGEVLFDVYSRGRYSTDASIYQIEPIGVVVPRHQRDIAATMQIAAEAGVTVLPRGGGTSQIGQTTGESLVVDVSKYLNRVLAFDAQARTVTVEPGLVLEPLNKFLKPHGLFYPVDVSTGNRATLGGMAGNNSCGSRSIRYGNMVHNVRAIEALLADGSEHRFAEVPADLSRLDADSRYAGLVRRMRTLGEREAGEIARRFPKLLRRVGGYNIDTLRAGGHNMAQLLVGSEGTLAFFTSLELNLQPIPPHKVLGICHFPTFYQAMDATQHIVKLDPSAVELVDRTMIELSRDIAMFRATVERCVRGEPDALLLVEFAGEDHAAQLRQLRQLEALMGELGFPDAVVEAIDPKFQSAVWEVRKAGLNIMMSMKGDGKPVSFIEDCAVPLEDLAAYTDRLTQVFQKHGTTGTWYAHASVGCLHVRPVLNMKDDQGAKKMRAIAEEAFAMVREYKGSHSGEHGDGLARSEFHESMFGPQIVRAFEEVKDVFDPTGLFNPGKIVRAPRMDDRRLFRYKPEYRAQPFDTVLDWSEWGGFAGAVEMCNNNGACRKAEPGVMCPSYRVTRDEQHLTRGRANTLRLAITGQLGRDALVSVDMHATMSLCVGCKGCKRECPTGVDMARMKIEFMHQYRKHHAPRLRERLVAWLPRYAPLAARLPWIFNLRDRIPGVPQLSRWFLGLSVRRALPKWRRDYFGSHPGDTPNTTGTAGEVVLWVDTFNTWFEPENARAALAVLQAAGYRVHLARPRDGGRPLCCGRTFLTAGFAAHAREEAQRLIDALAPFAARGMPIVGLEPSCLLSLRDELVGLIPGEATRSIASHALLFEEFLIREKAAGRLKLSLTAQPGQSVLLHGHCHQKAFGAMSAVQQSLALVPGLEVKMIESSCCGMAGAFGYEAEHELVSMRMGEMSLLPAVREASAQTWVVADGTSCRAQIRDGAGRVARHVAAVLAAALNEPAQGNER
jgi:FAD/FMN-containing dehydrogenase/Fe-S oxidoreductase